VSKWIGFSAEFATVHLRLVVPDHFDPDNDEHVQYLWDHINDWVYDPEVEEVRYVKVIETPGPQRVKIVDGFGDDAKVLRTEMRDPRPDGTIADDAIADPVTLDPNQGSLL
jgi:hypothetical protein